MSLLLNNPLALWLLLAVPLALLLALLARRERRRVVASLRPWQALLAMPRPRPQRNRLDLETLAAMLVPLLAALALAEPELALPNGKPPPLHILVDDSASMATRAPDGRSRWQEGTATLERLASHVPERSAVLYAFSQPGAGRVRPSLQATADELSTYGPSAEPQTAAEREQVLAAALQLAQADEAPLLWISDTPAPLASPRLIPLRVGQTGRNVGIVSTGSRQSAEGDVAIWAVVASSAEDRVQATLQAEADGRSLFEQELDLAPRDVRLVQTTAPASARQVTWRVRMPEDDLALDDEATLLIDRCRVRIDAARLPRLALALTAAAGCRLAEESPDLVVAQSEDDLPPGVPVLLAAPEAPVAGLVQLGGLRTINTASVASRAAGLPPICAAGFAAEVSEATLPAGAEVLMVGDSAQGEIPLVATWAWQGRPVAWIAAMPQAWTAGPGFPVLIAELVQRLQPALAGLPGLEETDNSVQSGWGALDAALETLRTATTDRERNRRAYPLARPLLLLAALLALGLTVKELRR